MPQKNHIIYIPGLNDQSFLNKEIAKFIPWFWKQYGIRVHMIQPHWSESNTFTPKLKMITDTVDALAKDGNKIFLVGQSAGGAAALNAFVIRKNKVAGAVNIDGRLRKGNHVFPSLDLAALGNPAFKESVLLFENENEKKLTKEDRKRIMVIHPVWDDIVPISTAKLNGTHEVTTPIVTHMLGGIMACTIYAKRIIYFLLSLEN